jgi:hypothetical protein
LQCWSQIVLVLPCPACYTRLTGHQTRHLSHEAADTTKITPSQLTLGPSFEIMSKKTYIMLYINHIPQCNWGQTGLYLASKTPGPFHESRSHL